MDNVIIKKMNLSHLDSIRYILGSSFDDFWSYDIFKSELEKENSEYVVATIRNEIVGFAGISIVLDTADITNIVVKERFRGRGISSLLLKNIITIAKSNNCSVINLEVNRNNNVAINLYEKFGFVQVGCRKGYYNGDDGLLFSKSI